MFTANDIVKTAISFIGIQESPNGSNRTPIGVEFGWNGVPWCAESVWVTFNRNGVKLLKTASANMLFDAVKRLTGSTVVPADKASSGDVVGFDWNGDGWLDHIGIVEANTGRGCVVLEGNTDNCYKRVFRSYKTMTSVARPAYIQGISGSVTVEKPYKRYAITNEKEEEMAKLVTVKSTEHDFIALVDANGIHPLQTEEELNVVQAVLGVAAGGELLEREFDVYKAVVGR